MNENPGELSTEKKFKKKDKGSNEVNVEGTACQISEVI